MNKVEAKFQPKALNIAGLLLFRKPDALHFIEECEKENIPILGIDGFFLTQHSTQPSIENSIDFLSPGSDLSSTHAKAIQFLQTRKEDLYFEVTCQ